MSERDQSHVCGVMFSIYRSFILWNVLSKDVYSLWNKGYQIYFDWYGTRIMFHLFGANFVLCDSYNLKYAWEIVYRIMS